MFAFAIFLHYGNILIVNYMGFQHNVEVMDFTAISTVEGVAERERFELSEP